MKFYNINGIISDYPSEAEFFVTENAIKEFVFKEGDLSYEIENKCNLLRQKIGIKLFDNINNLYYYYNTPIYPIAAFAGIDAEVKISKLQFEKIYNDIREKEKLNKILYYYDVENLIGNIQNAVIETKYLVGLFYKIFNENSFLIHENYTTIDNGIQFASGPVVVNITSVINHLFINLYSQLDFVTKLIYEIENLQIDFKIYPRLKSKDIVYGDAKKTTFNNKINTIYELSENIRIIMYLRNEIVHNASIDSIPKVYQLIENKKIVEKFILLPDFEKGIIQTFKNRKRFFDNDTKLNEILPSIVNEFWKRLLYTLDDIKIN